VSRSSAIRGNLCRVPASSDCNVITVVTCKLYLWCDLLLLAMWSQWNKTRSWYSNEHREFWYGFWSGVLWIFFQ